MSIRDHQKKLPAIMYLPRSEVSLPKAAATGASIDWPSPEGRSRRVKSLLLSLLYLTLRLVNFENSIRKVQQAL